MRLILKYRRSTSRRFDVLLYYHQYSIQEVQMRTIQILIKTHEEVEKYPSYRQYHQNDKARQPQEQQPP